MTQKTLDISPDGWVAQIRHAISPNHDDRPENTDVSLLVIHNISLPPDNFEQDWIVDFFTNQLDPKADPYFETIADLKVSAHFLIRRDGELIQFVSTEKRAWHAGQSCFEDQHRCNDFSIGIELEGSDHQPFTENQYQQLVRLTATLQNKYPAITLNRITGHSDIAPGRKTDPGPFFDWSLYRQKLIA